MLCTSCAGTEFVAFTQEIRNHQEVEPARDACPSCGADLGHACPDCLGLGYRLSRDGFCSHCGSTMAHWLRCKSCNGAGIIPVLHRCTQPVYVENRINITPAPRGQHG